MYAVFTLVFYNSTNHQHKTPLYYSTPVECTQLQYCFLHTPLSREFLTTLLLHILHSIECNKLQYCYKYSTQLSVLNYSTAKHTPPQLSVLDRSFPVPSGRTATGGYGRSLSLSIEERIQPTVPSPPQARMRTFGTFP